SVLATSNNIASADSDGGAGSIVLSIAVMLPTAIVGGGTTAEFDGTLVHGVTDAASLDVEAHGENRATATTTVVSIGIVGASGATADAEITSDANVEALVGSTASIATSGAVTVLAQLQGEKNHAKATADGGSGGILANISILLAQASVAGGVSAELDGKVLGS